TTFTRCASSVEPAISVSPSSRSKHCCRFGSIGSRAPRSSASRSGTSRSSRRRFARSTGCARRSFTSSRTATAITGRPARSSTSLQARTTAAERAAVRLKPRGRYTPVREQRSREILRAATTREASATEKSMVSTELTDTSEHEEQRTAVDAVGGEPEAWERWETRLVLISLAIGAAGLVVLGWLVDHFILS